MAKYNSVCSHRKYNLGCWLREVINLKTHLGYIARFLLPDFLFKTVGVSLLLWA